MEESVILVDALRAAGSYVHLTTYPGVGHDSWTQTYADPGLYLWLFAQRRR
jgi:acetyl esterase/lipase